MSPRLRSDEAFGLETFWWRPDDDGRPPNDGTQPPSHGTLRFTPDHGVELTVFDLLTDLTPLQVPGRLHALFGETLEHKPCVLFDALPITSSGSLFGAHNHLVVHAHQFVLGEHVPSPDDVESKTFDVRLRGAAAVSFLAALGRGVRALAKSVPPGAQDPLRRAPAVQVRALPGGSGDLHDRIWLVGECGLQVGTSVGSFLAGASRSRMTTATELPTADAAVWREQFERWWDASFA